MGAHGSRWRTSVVALAAVALVLAACSGSGDDRGETTTAPTPTTANPSSTSAPRPGSTVPTSTDGPVDPTPVGAPGTFTFLGGDEFDRPTLDTTTWNVGPPWGGQFCQGAEFFTPDALGLEGGVLHIPFRRRAAAIDSCGISRTYDTAMVQSKGKLTVGSGQYLEFRVQAARGPGLWSIAWVLPLTWPDDACRVQQYELDIFEHLGRDPGHVNQSAHTRGTCDELVKDEGLVPGTDFTSSFHVVGVDWYPDHVQYYVDGQPTFRSSAFAGHDEPGFVLLNGFLGRAGDDWAEAATSATPTEAEFLVDYVRVWRRA